MTMVRPTTVCPAVVRRSAIARPDVSVSSVRVSLTVMTKHLMDAVPVPCVRPGSWVTHPVHRTLGGDSRSELFDEVVTRFLKLFDQADHVASG